MDDDKGLSRPLVPGETILSFSRELDDRLAEVQSKWTAIHAERTSDDEFHRSIETLFATLDSLEDYLTTTTRQTYSKDGKEIILMMHADLMPEVRAAKGYSELLLAEESEEVLHLLGHFLDRIEKQIQMFSNAFGENPVFTEERPIKSGT